MGWCALLTIPTGVITLLAFALVWISDRITRRRRAHENQIPIPDIKA
jgi:hypothetical protein